MKGHFSTCRRPGFCTCELKLYIVVGTIGLVAMGIDILGSWYSGSLSLLSEGGHMLIDNITVGVSAYVAFVISSNKDREKNLRIKAGYVNASLFFVIALLTFDCAILRWRNPPELKTEWMMLGALFCAILNLLQHYFLQVLHGGCSHTTTHKGMSMHVLSDLIQNLAIIVSGIFIYFTGKNTIDLVLSICIALMLMWWSVKQFMWSVQEKIHVH